MGAWREECLGRMEGPMQKGDQEGQDSNKVEKSRNMNQNLGSWKNVAEEDKKEEKLCLRRGLLG